MNNLLAQVGFETKEVENGEQAVAVFQQWHPHFIWMDINMPLMDGYESTRRIRALSGGDNVKIVALTASAFREQYEQILAAGCDDMVLKPYRAQEIYDTLAKQLDLCFNEQKLVLKN